MTEVSQVDVHSAFLEYGARFVEPALEHWHQGRVTQALLRVLGPWGASLETVSFSQPSTKASELTTSVELPQRGVVVSAGIGKLVLMGSNPAWSQAQETVQITEAALTAVREALGVAVEQQEATISLHFSVPGASPRDLIARFLNLDAPLIGSDSIRSYGVSVYRDDGYWVLDTSRVYQDALFLRLARSAEGEAPLDALARALYRDECVLAEALGLRIEDHDDSTSS